MEKCEEAKHSTPRRAAEDAPVTAQHDVGGTEMSLTTWRRWRARVIILRALVSSCAYGRCFFAAKSTTDLHTGVGVWVGGGACVCVGGGVAVSWVRVGRSCNSD
jgi:hypothetical protein